MQLYKFIGSFVDKTRRFKNRCVATYQLSKFGLVGSSCTLDGPGDFSYSNIYLGDNVSIGVHSTFLSSDAKIHVGNKVMFGPNVTLISGDHRTDLVGKYMKDITIEEKLPVNDQDIIIEDDVWVGANSLILKGVKISTGCVIAAGSVVTKSTEPYCIYAGVPARKIKDRFSVDDLNKHLMMLK